MINQRLSVLPASQTLAVISTPVRPPAGAATINYGLFVNAVISFLIVAWAVFLLVKGMNRLRRQEVIGVGGRRVAIFARAIGIPAVMGVGDATTVLRDGEMVTVDGSRGTVVPDEG